MKQQFSDIRQEAVMTTEPWKTGNNKHKSYGCSSVLPEERFQVLGKRNSDLNT